MRGSALNVSSGFPKLAYIQQFKSSLGIDDATGYDCVCDAYATMHTYAVTVPADRVWILRMVKFVRDGAKEAGGVAAGETRLTIDAVNYCQAYHTAIHPTFTEVEAAEFMDAVWWDEGNHNVILAGQRTDAGLKVYVKNTRVTLYYEEIEK